MSKKETIKRYIIFTIGMFFTAFGVAISKHSNLGVSTISSFPSVVSYKFDFISFGVWSMIWNLILVALQMVILRKNFHPIQFWQIPVSFIFGYFIDLGARMISPISSNTYITQIILVIAGMIVLAFGVSLTFIADVVMNPGEGIVKAVADAYHMNLGTAKTLVDIICVASSIVLSLVFFDMKLLGVREGTLIAAFFTGFVVRFFDNILLKPLNKYFKKEN